MQIVLLLVIPWIIIFVVAFFVCDIDRPPIPGEAQENVLDVKYVEVCSIHLPLTIDLEYLP